MTEKAPKKEKVPSLREQQKAATRSQMTQMGIQLFLKQGFTETTIEQIVEPLGIAKRTFFRYFKSKEEVVFAFYEDKTADLVAKLASRPKKESPFKAVCAALSIQLELYDTNPEFAFALVRLIKENPDLTGKGFEKKIAREKALADALIAREGENTLSALKAQLIVGVASVAWMAALDEWYEQQGKTDLREIMERAFSIAGKL